MREAAHEEMRTMAVFRFLASLFLLIAVIALVADATPTEQNGGAFVPTPLGQHWAAIAPSTLESAKSAVASTGVPWVWDRLIEPMLSIPTFLLFGTVGALAGYAGRRRRGVNIYIN